MNLYGQRWLKNTGSAQAKVNGHTITMTKPNRPEAIAGYAGSEDAEDDPETH